MEILECSKDVSNAEKIMDNSERRKRRAGWWTDDDEDSDSINKVDNEGDVTKEGNNRDADNMNLQKLDNNEIVDSSNSNEYNKEDDDILNLLKLDSDKTLANSKGKKLTGKEQSPMEPKFTNNKPKKTISSRNCQVPSLISLNTDIYPQHHQEVVIQSPLTSHHLPAPPGTIYQVVVAARTR